MTALLLLVAVAVLSYSNGANDNFKGVATLWGSRTAGFKRALWWATLTTAAGALCSVLLAGALVKAFSGKGLVPDRLVADPAFLAAVAFGAAAAVLLATLAGLPVSTTHSLLGGLLGAGALAARSQLNLSHLGWSFLLPLIVSPLLAWLATAVLYSLLHRARMGSGITAETCVCIGQEAAVMAPSFGMRTPLREVGRTSPPAGEALAAPMPAASAGALSVTLGDVESCSRQYSGTVLGISSQQLVDKLHYLSTGAVSFARGLNDTPKIVALLLAAQALNPHLALLAVAGGMALGGLLHSRKVAETMSVRITEMNSGQALTANVVTGALVILASRFGLPVSTTHVSVGSIFGIAASAKKRDLGVIRMIVLSWVLTLPCAAVLSALAYWVCT